jgi:hypothetical protein
MPRIELIGDTQTQQTLQRTGPILTYSVSI